MQQSGQLVANLWIYINGHLPYVFSKTDLNAIQETNAQIAQGLTFRLETVLFEQVTPPKKKIAISAYDWLVKLIKPPQNR